MRKPKSGRKKVPAGIHEYLARLGAKGGKAGSIEAKRRAGRLGAAKRWGKPPT